MERKVYSTKCEPEVIGFYTTSENVMDQIKAAIINETLRMRQFRKELHKKFPELFKKSLKNK